MNQKRVFIYDTTLRDGAQGAGVSFSGAGKLKFAKRLDAFGVDYIEGGYAGSNKKDMAFFEQIRKEELSHTKIVAFGSTRRANMKVKDDPMVACLLDAETEVVAVFGKTWKLHVMDVLRTTLEDNNAMIADTVGFLKERGKEVFFDAEHFFDGYKDDPDVAMGAVRSAVGAGADVIVLCDTNGGSMPDEIYRITHEVSESFGVPLSIHAHNDAGMAVANTIEAVRAGAVQVQGTINGYGERCGNADLCTILPNLVLKTGALCVPREKLADLRGLSGFVDDLINMRHNASAPYVGRNAFCHKGGPHIDGVEKNSKTFEHVEPDMVGNERRTLVSELSGGRSILLKAIELGIDGKKSKEETHEILDALKDMESKGYAFESADASFKILVQKVLKEHKPFFELAGFRVVVEKQGDTELLQSEATVKVRVDGKMEHTAAEGGGPVEALDSALRKALKRFYPEIAEVFLTDYRVSILDPDEATAAKTRVLIESSDGKTSWGTVGVSENIIEASWEALVDSVEYKLFKEEEKRKLGRNSDG
ncbi:MAG: citramalate synthase [Kiritimatiellae bacterium]|nr:citramalate synthase [Kiritimatiellia bacterium]